MTHPHPFPSSSALQPTRPRGSLSAPDPNSGHFFSSCPMVFSQPWVPLFSHLILISQLGHPIQSSLLSPTPTTRPHLGTEQISAPRDSRSLSYTPSRGLPHLYRSHPQDTPFCLQSLPPASRTYLSHGDPLLLLQILPSGTSTRTPLSNSGTTSHLGLPSPSWLAAEITLSSESPLPITPCSLSPRPPAISVLTELGSRCGAWVSVPGQVHLESCPYNFWGGPARMPQGWAKSPFPASVWVPKELGCGQDLSKPSLAPTGSVLCLALGGFLCSLASPE